MKTHFFVLTVLLGILIPVQALSQNLKKENLKVLYVGGTAEFETIMSSNKSPELIKESAKGRMASFEKFLNEYFTAVKVIDASEYIQSMSDDYDVTIMDGEPNPIKPATRDYRHGIFRSAEYFSEDFSRPILTIGYLSNELGRTVGTKNDWYCLCLNSHMHSWKADHQIFKGPFKVKLKVEDRKTPEPIFSFPRFFKGGIVPPTLKMCRVQTYDLSLETPDVRIGMVSRPGDYESPEAEIISSGECAKSPDAVAIGRHGNWFHWGFAASPAYLTEEAKPLLANAIVYISHFAGQTPIARKYNDRVTTREGMLDRKYFFTKESWEQNAKVLKEFNEARLKKQASIRKKIETGETISQSEKDELSYRTERIPTYEEYLQQVSGELYSKFGTNIDEYIKFIDDNYPFYTFSNDRYGGLIIDETAKILGIGTNDKAILDAAIKVLENKSDKISQEKAKELLERYTLVDFPTSAQWREWYNNNSKKLFFSESAGWIFLINSRDKGVNDYRAKEERMAAKSVKTEETNDQNPVSVAFGTKYMQDGNWLLTVKFSIQKGYHIYAQLAPSDPFITTKLDVNFPEGLKKIGNTKVPTPEFYNQSGTTVFRNEAVYQIPFEGGKYGDKIEVNIEYQCCDKTICFAPVQNKYTIEIK